MLRKRLLLYTLALFMVHFSFSQDTTVPKPVSIIVSPALIPVSNTELGLQPGLQLRLKRWALAAELAFALHKPTQKFSSIHYLRKSIELKHYFKPKDNLQVYLSAQLLYAKRNFTDTNGGTYFKREDSYGGINNKRYDYSHAYINSPILIGVAKGGAEYTLSKKFFLDYFAGFGFRRTYTQYQNIEGEAERPYGLLELSFPKSAYRYDRTISKLHFTTGFRIGYNLW